MPITICAQSGCCRKLQLIEISPPCRDLHGDFAFLEHLFTLAGERICRCGGLYFTGISLLFQIHPAELIKTRLRQSDLGTQKLLHGAELLIN